MNTTRPAAEQIYIAQLSPKPSVTGLNLSSGLGCAYLHFSPSTGVGTLTVSVSDLGSNITTVDIHQGSITANGARA